MLFPSFRSCQDRVRGKEGRLMGKNEVLFNLRLIRNVWIKSEKGEKPPANFKFLTDIYIDRKRKFLDSLITDTESQQLPDYEKKISEQKKALEEAEIIRKLLFDEQTKGSRQHLLDKLAKMGMNPENYFIENKFIPKYFAEDVMKATHYKTLKKTNKMYRYHNGVYLEDGKDHVKKTSVKYLGEEYSIHRFKEVVSFIQGSTYIDPNEINNNWINLENGLLNPITKEFKEHTPEIFSIARIPIEYDSKADCPLFKEKLEGKLDGQTLKVVQEMFGYCYLPGQKYETAFLLYGGRRTMKSTTLFILAQMLGDGNVSAFPLQYLAENQFASAYLYGVPANICADLSSSALKDTGRFMTITGGDKISAGKKHEHPISFFPSTKLIFSCNTIPPTANKNLAFYRRWKILPFTKETPEDKVDKGLREKLLKELPGVLNWSLIGLERLLKNDEFSYWLDENGVKDLYERSSDTIQSFIYNNIDCEHDEGVLTKREVFKSYVEYCRHNGLDFENVIRFGRMFKALTGCGVCKKGRIPAYSGVNFKGGVKEIQKML